MALWNIVSNQDLENETEVFGTRQFAEADGCLFECSTLAVIKPGSEYSSTPNVRAISDNSFIYIVIDNTLTVLSGENCCHEYSTAYEATVDCFTVCEAWNMLILCLRDGSIFGINRQNRETLFQASLASSYDAKLPTFINVVPCSDCYIVFHRTGSSYKLFNELTGVVAENGEVLIEQSVINICIEQINEAHFINNAPNTAIITSEKSFDMLLGGREICTIKNDDTFHCIMPNDLTVKKMQYLRDVGKILCLTSKGTICLIDPETLFIFPLDLEAQDFIIISTPSDESSTYSLLILCNDSKNLKVVEYPGMKVRYTLSTRNKIFLMNFMDTPLELMFLEYIENIENGKQLHVRALEERQPEARLTRLLSRNRFDEAEWFVERFRLDKDQVHLARAKVELRKYLDSTEDLTKVDFIKLMELLDNIKDDLCVVDCCMHALHFENNTVAERKLLKYTIKRISQVPDMDNQLATLQGILLKLDTFELLGENALDVSWSKFRNCNPFELCLYLLGHKDCMIAAAVWSRHYSSFSKKIRVKEAEMLLAKLPKRIHPATLLPSLRHFIPGLLNAEPLSLSMIVNWAMETTLAFETNHFIQWPAIGRDFCQAIIELLYLDEHHSGHPMLFSMDVQLEDLMALKKALCELITLRENYQMKIPLEKYMQPDLNEVAEVLLKKVSPDNIESLLKDFLNPKLLTQNIDQNVLIENYITRDIEKSYKDHNWETKVSTLVKFIHNEQTALQCILCILKHAELPWSPVILELYKKGSSSHHHLSHEINAAYRVTGVRFMMQKYNFESILCDEEETLMLVRKILAKNESDAMSDIFKITTAEPKIAPPAYNICVSHYLRHGDVKKCIDILEKLDKEHKKSCGTFLIIRAEYILKKKKPVPKREMGFLEILSYLQMSSELDKDLMEDIDICVKLHSLKLKFDIHIDRDEYALKNFHSTVLSEGIEKILKDNESPSDVYEKLRLFTKLLGIRIPVALVELCNKTSNLSITVYCVRMFLLSKASLTEDQDALLKLAKYLASLYGKKSNNSYVKSLEADINTQKALDQTFPLAWELVNTIMFHCSFHEDLSIHFLLHCWLTIAAIDLQDNFSILHMEPFVDPTKLHSTSQVYGDVVTFPDSNKILSLMSQMICNIFPDTPKITDINDNKLLLKKLQCTQYHFTTVRVAHLLCLNINGNVENYIKQDVLDKSLEKTLVKMVARSKFDVEGAMTILRLTTDPNSITERLMTQLSSQPARQLNVAILAQEYQASLEKVRHGPKFSKLLERRKCCSWRIKLANLNLSTSDISTDCNVDWYVPILKKLYTLPAPYTLLQEFCQDFTKLENLQSIVIDQVVYLLSDIKLEYKTLANNSMKSDIVVTLSEGAIMDMCTEYIIHIKNAGGFINSLKILLEQVNFYHYEVYIVVMNILIKFGANDQPYADWLEILKFLKTYKRNMPLGKLERDTWMQHFPNDCDVPTIAKYRMSFRALTTKDIWDVITHEISVATCENWLTQIGYLKLGMPLKDSRDKFCLHAIKNTMLAIYQNSPKGDWCLNMKEELTRKECMAVLEHVSEMESYSSLLYFIMNYSTSGADIVAASKNCYDFAVQCIENEVKLPAPTVAKLQKRYPIYATMHILHTHKLAETNLMALVEDPKELILALYNHPLILRNSRNIVTEDPDVNRVVEEIANLHSTKINLTVLKFNLLKQWLQSSTGMLDMDDSITMPVLSQIAVDSNSGAGDMNFDEELLRACYMLKSYDKKTVFDMLGSYLTHESDENTGVTTTMKLRALQCMLAVAGYKNVEEYLHLSAQQQQTMLWELFTMNYLECLGFSYTQSDYSELHKSSLVGHLIDNFGSNPKALSVSVQLCQNNNVIDDKIWNSLITHLIRFKMVRELHSSLSWLRVHPRLCALPVISQAWQCVIRAPFIEADAKRNPDEEKNCAAALLKLQCCPVYDSLDMLDLAECCIKADRPYMAAALLPLAKPEDRKSILKIVRANSNPQELEEDVKSLEELGILFVPKILEILHE